MNSIKTYDGLRVFCREIPSVRSVAIGIMVGAGCVNESPDESGISHYIEHMLFKGTERRSAFDIVEETDMLGANMNAFTSKLGTCYYTLSLDGDAEKCMDILTDMFFNSTFDEKEMEKEKGVVLEEIAMNEDTPDDVCLELGASAFFKGHPLEKAILGTKDTVMSFTRAQLFDYKNKYYTAENTVVSVVGNITEAETDRLIKKYFVPALKKGRRVRPQTAPPQNKACSVSKFKDIEQSNIGIFFPGIKIDDENEAAMQIFNTVFGGGMSSRLFQHVREKLGLAYSVYSYPSSYINEGTFAIYVGTNKASVEKAVEALRKEIDDVVENGITEKEFEKGKAQMKSALVFGQESTSTLMRVDLKSMLFSDRPFDIDGRLALFEKVSRDDVKALAAKIFDFEKVVVSYVGPETDADLKAVLCRERAFEK